MNPQALHFSPNTTRNATIARRFAAAAPRYDAHSSHQREVAQCLAARVRRLVLPVAPRVLEIGCGTGHLTCELLPVTGGEWIVSDIAPAMVTCCRSRVGSAASFVAMDGECLALAPGSFDLIVSSLAVQWFSDLPSGLASLARLLAPGGRMALATLGAGTFLEWHAALAEVDPDTVTNDYPDAARLARSFPSALGVAIEEQTLVERFAEPLDFLRGLRRIGADTPAPAKRALTTGQMRQALRAFAADGEALSSYHVLYAIASKPVDSR